MVFRDPPYNVPIDGNVCGLGRVRHKEFAMASGEMSEAEFSNFLEAVLQHLHTHSRDGAIHYICMDWRWTPIQEKWRRPTPFGFLLPRI